MPPGIVSGVHSVTQGPARIESIRIRNYRALRDTQLKCLTPLTVLLGPNGSGKSTLFDVFAFLSECFSIGLRKAWGRRGRFKELRSRGGEGPIEFEIKYREQHPDRLSRIVGVLARRVPRLEGVAAELLADGRILLQIKDGPFEKPILAKWVSDGTLNMVNGSQLGHLWVEGHFEFGDPLVASGGPTRRSHTQASARG